MGHLEKTNTNLIYKLIHLTQRHNSFKCLRFSTITIQMFSFMDGRNNHPLIFYILGAILLQNY